MSDPQAYPDDEQVDAIGVDPDIPSTDDQPSPEDTSPAEEEKDEDDEDVHLSDLP